jgi:NAD(P) transhydrogenase
MSRNATAPVARFDFVILGSGPAGQRAALQAAKLKKRVLVIEREHVGGHCLHRATIPSKTLREAALLMDVNARNYLERVMERKRSVIESEVNVLEQNIERHGVEYLQGSGSFVSPHRIRIEGLHGVSEVEGDRILIAVGTSPHRPDGVPFDGKTVFDSDTVLELRSKPGAIAVVGAGVIGCEYASIFARMGAKVTLVSRADHLLRGVDDEIVAALKRHFETNRILLRLGTEIESIQPEVKADGTLGVAIGLDGKQHVFDAVLYCAGRKGNVDKLNLAAAGLTANERGLIAVDANYRTVIPHIYAAGDVIGPPALAASSAEQGRLAAAHAFGIEAGKFPDSFPYGIYTIPEISWTGRHEEDLRRNGIPFVVGRANYREIARGRILGDAHGFLKVLVHAETRAILGIHIIGTGATELVHIGQLAMDLGAPIEFFVNNVFNYPTLAEGYKVAAFDAVAKLELAPAPRRQPA